MSGLGALRTANAIMTTASGVGLGLSVMMAGFLFFGTEPVAAMWVTEGEGGIEEACEPHRLDEPIYSLVALGGFAAEVVTEINDYDYLDWDSRLPGLMDAYFTPEAGREYYRQFAASKLLKRVQDDYYTVQGQIARRPIVVAQSDVEPRRSWTVQIPVEVFYLTGARTTLGLQTTKNTQRLMYTLRLVEQPPTTDNFRGVGVADIKADPLRNFEMLDELRDD